MFRQFAETIKKDNSIQPYDRIIVGISGGADSVCLLHLLWRLQAEYQLEIYGVHVHHGLRKEADKDAQYVKEFTASLQIPCQIYYVNVPKEAKRRKLGEEETGRQLRYEIFQKEAASKKVNKIAVGHHMNDQGETFLMRLMRGSGSLGLGSMKKVEGNIIRPLLGFTRQEVEKYCLEQQLYYCQDHTNELSAYTRNRIRLELIPYIQQYFNPNIIHTLYQTAELLNEQEEYMEKETIKLYPNCVVEEDTLFRVNTDVLQDYDIVIQKRILYKALTRFAQHKRDIGYVHIGSILQLMERQSGKEIHLPYNIIVKKQYMHLVFTQGSFSVQGYCYSLKIPGNQYIPEINKWIQTEIIEKEQQRNEFLQNNYTNYLDYDKIKDELVLRTRQSGDVIALSNVSGFKKIKDFFIDNKIPYEQRQQIPLLAQNKEILWIVGYRYSKNYCVTEQTKNILKITLLEHL